MTADHLYAYQLGDEAFDELESLLASEHVPADCMDVEMLDGLLAAVACAPVAIGVERWMPVAWSAHGSEVEARGQAVQRAITLMRAYHDEVVATVGLEEGWEPFCYGAEDDDELLIGENWMNGFFQGLELWPEGWTTEASEYDAQKVGRMLDELRDAWDEDEGSVVDNESGLAWLEAAGNAVAEIRACWIAEGKTVTQPLSPVPLLGDDE